MHRVCGWRYTESVRPALKPRILALSMAALLMLLLSFNPLRLLRSSTTCCSWHFDCSTSSTLADDVSIKVEEDDNTIEAAYKASPSGQTVTIKPQENDEF